MALVTWDQSYSVGVQQCDEDHKKLFSLLNALHDAMRTGKGAQVIQAVVKELAAYTNVHFSREEALLEKTNYPALAPHRVQHREFVNKVEQFQQELDAGRSSQSIAVSTFLRDWLSNHIKQTDRKYSQHLNAKGVS